MRVERDPPARVYIHEINDNLCLKHGLRRYGALSATPTIKGTGRRHLMQEDGDFVDPASWRSAGLLLKRQFSVAAWSGLRVHAFCSLMLIKKGDDVHKNHRPVVTRKPQLDDGQDGFQFYESGAANG